jgi:CheY-like chemotaxis protein
MINSDDKPITSIKMRKIESVLLVEDDPISQHITSLIIKDCNLAEEVHIAQNGKEALTKLQVLCGGTPPDCPSIILLDLNMPVMNGIEFMEEYFSGNGKPKAGPKLYVLTSSTNNKDKNQAEKFPISGYIEKPLTYQKIKDIVDDFQRK